MVSSMGMMASRMIGTLAVILVVSAFFGSSDFADRFVKKQNLWEKALIAGPCWQVLSAGRWAA